jgi:tetratricopeptide (TPR) repeat protein
MVRQLVRQAVRIRDADPAAQQHAQLRRYVEDLCDGVDFARVADFLGELIAVPSTERPCPELRAARSDPQIMATWLGRSFGEWLSGECARGPLLLVLEDLHWGDLPSVTYLGEGLRALTTKPLMLLALARPEVHDSFPNIWPFAEKNELVLGRLAPRAAERLVRAALGEGLARESVARIVERADGNAFYLEELIRRVAEGAGDTLPQTVLALVQSRLERLEPEGRRILRAASVFGEVFWTNGIAALLGAVDPEDPGAWLEALARGEMISAVREGSHPDDHEYVFRHGLLREAAYAMLTDEDRTTGHRLAAQWLEQVGEKDPLILADHFELGGQPQRAGSWLSKAAVSALEGGSTHDAILLCDRAFACGVDDAQRPMLWGKRAAAFMERGDLISAVASGREAMNLLPAGSPGWFACAGNLFSTGVLLNDQTVTMPVLQAILSAPVPTELSLEYARAISSTSFGLTAIGALEVARSLLERTESMEKEDLIDSLSVARMGPARSYLDLVTGNLGSAFQCLLRARSIADRMLHATDQAMSRMLLVGAYAEAGDCSGAETVERELLSICDAAGRRFFLDRGAILLARAKLNAGRVAEAVEHLRPLLGQADPQLVLSARSRLAHAFIGSGDWDSASGEAEASLANAGTFPSTQSTALAAIARIALHRGQLTEALSFAERGLAEESRGSWFYDGSVLRFSRAEALWGLRREDEARIAIGKARDRVLRIVASLHDPKLRHSYVTGIAVNARTLSLAEEWIGEDGS